MAIGNRAKRMDARLLIEKDCNCHFLSIATGSQYHYGLSISPKDSPERSSFHCVSHQIILRMHPYQGRKNLAGCVDHDPAGEP